MSTSTTSSTDTPNNEAISLSMVDIPTFHAVYDHPLGCQQQQEQPECAMLLSHNHNLQPFDWLTSAASLESILNPILCDKTSNLVLHVGCGSSTLGELLIENKNFNVSTVVNVDCDVETLRRMQQRWSDKVNQSHNTNEVLTEHAMQFVTADFTLPDSLRHYTDNSRNISKFDVVLDKSTLDCMLCTDTGVIGLLLETYRCLKENGGVYLVISFHPPDFIRPLLEYLPGANWDVECTSIQRQIEQLNNSVEATTGSSSTDNNSSSAERAARIENEIDKTSSENIKTKHTWSSGTFQPDEVYVKNVTVLTCRRRPTDNSSNTSDANDKLDWDQVYDHVHRINNQWYQQTNPMLTKERVQAIERAFAELAGDDNKMELHLQQCYPIIFTDGERENLSYDDFIDDWRSFLLKYSSTGEHDDQQGGPIPTDRMSFKTAIAFLHVMQ